MLMVRSNWLQRQMGLFMLSISLVVSGVLLYTVNHGGPQVYAIGGWEPPYGIVLVADSLSALLIVMTSAVLFGGMLYIVSCKDQVMNSPVFVPLTLTMSVGINGAILTGDIFTFFVFMEVMVTSSVVLVALSDNRYGLEAAMKYLLISSMGTLFLLIGIASTYATFGTLNMADLGRLLLEGERPILAQASAIMLMAAFLLKSAAVPFHFWQPDFHTTAPTPLSALLSSIVVKVGIYGIIRLTTLLFVQEAPAIQSFLIFIGVIGIYFGGFTALRTHNIKRILAYSTLAQIGFILVAIGWGGVVGLTAAIVYIVNHAFIKSSLLMLSGAVASRTKTKTAQLDELVGAGKGMTGISLLYFLGGLALAGIPPLNGFISKFMVVSAGVHEESWVVVGLLVAGGLLTLTYMMRTWQKVFQAEPNENTVALKPDGYGDSILAPALLITACVALGVFATPLVEQATLAAHEISNSNIYISAVLHGRF